MQKQRRRTHCALRNNFYHPVIICMHIILSKVNNANEKNTIGYIGSRHVIII